MANERPTENLILTGNYYKDCVDNIIEIIQREQEEDEDQELTYIKRITEVYDYDVVKVPSVPSIAVNWTDAEERVRTIGQNNVSVSIYNDIEIFYYHDEIKDEIRKDEIRDALWELARILRRNSDVNGLSAEGATIEGVQLLNRLRNDIPYAGGRIFFRVPVRIKTRRGVS